MAAVLQLVQAAAELRQRSGQTEPAYSTRVIVEECFPDALVTGRTLPPGVLEAVARTPTGPVILYARGLSPAEQRYAIAHAIGHLLFDGERAFRQPGQPRDPRVERRADAFADELLIPLAELEPYVGRWPSRNQSAHELYLDQVDEIASHFKVLSGVVDRRIRQLRSLVRKHA
jgi:Zn-dependent peptidase ImmA (M78 family)